MALNWFRSKWKTKCARCRRPIEEGDWLAYSRDEPDQIVCKPCGRSEEEEDE